ncbi:unnamed protein product [Owenia fusiformis]|uniref:Uncharacterized protein n=1 Tax=Owenia fusiformis TaxID=6347 RepID=A0A8S4N0D2_OWEFU|nr:unnamed protein product [Owenia fusiformis]
MISRIKPIDRNAIATKDKQVSRSGLQSRSNGQSKERHTTTRDKSSAHQRRHETWDTLIGWTNKDADDGNSGDSSDFQQWVEKRQQLQQKFDTAFTSRKYPDISVQYLSKPGSRCESIKDNETFTRASLHDRFHNEHEASKDATFKQYNPKAVDIDLDAKLIEYIESKDRLEHIPVPRPSERYKRLLCVISGTADPETTKDKLVRPLSSVDAKLNKMSIQFDVTKSKNRNANNNAKQNSDNNESDTVGNYKNDTLSRAKRIIVLAESRPQTVLSEKHDDSMKAPEIHIHVPSIHGDNDENESNVEAEEWANNKNCSNEKAKVGSSNALHDSIKTLSKLSNQEKDKINAKSQHVVNQGTPKSQLSPRAKMIKSAPSMTNLQIQNMAMQSLKRGVNMNAVNTAENREPLPKPKLSYTHSSSGSSTVKHVESRRGSATQSIASNDTALSKYMIDQIDSQSLCSNVISDITEHEIDPSQAWNKYPNGFRNPYAAIDTYYSSMSSSSPLVHSVARRKGSSPESNGNQYESTTKSIPLTMKKISMQDYNNDANSSHYTFDQSRRLSGNISNAGVSKRRTDNVKLPPAPHGSPKLTSNSSGENSVESAGQLDEHSETIIKISDLIAANTNSKSPVITPRQNTNSAKQVKFDSNANDNEGETRNSRITAHSRLLKHENDLLRLREGIDVDWVKEAHNPHLGPPGFRPPAQKSASQRAGLKDTGAGQLYAYGTGKSTDGADQRQPRWASSLKLTSDYNRSAISSAPAKLNGNVFDEKMPKRRRALSGLYTDQVYGMDNKCNASAEILYRFARRNLHQKLPHEAASKQPVTYMTGQGVDSGLKFAHHKFRQKQRKKGQKDFLVGQ